MKKALFIVGPTAAGKTSLGLKLANKCKGEIISADSRQVYKGMDIGTGKDIPPDFSYQESSIIYKNIRVGYFLNSTKIWMLDLVNPDQDFNLSYFRNIAFKIIKNLWKKNRLPIIVGGTGLYIKALYQSMPEAEVPPDPGLRKNLDELKTKQLQSKLEKIDPRHYASMNHSDRNNPRRLIRAIEIAKHLRNHPQSNLPRNSILQDASLLFIGLKVSKKTLRKKISQRVEQRLKQGAEQEVRELLGKGYNFDLPAMSALGYIQWKQYFACKKTKAEVVKKWKQDEFSYARRQLTWFKKNSRINWFDIEKSGIEKQVVNRVCQWYSVF